MDYVFEALLKGIVRGVAYVVGEIIVRLVFYYTAAILLKGISTGKYPTDIHQDPFDSPSAVILTAIGAIIHIFIGNYLISKYG